MPAKFFGKDQVKFEGRRTAFTLEHFALGTRALRFRTQRSFLPLKAQFVRILFKTKFILFVLQALHPGFFNRLSGKTMLIEGQSPRKLNRTERRTRGALPCFYTWQTCKGLVLHDHLVVNLFISLLFLPSSWHSLPRRRTIRCGNTKDTVLPRCRLQLLPSSLLNSLFVFADVTGTAGRFVTAHSLTRKVRSHKLVAAGGGVFAVLNELYARRERLVNIEFNEAERFSRSSPSKTLAPSLAAP